MQTTTPGRRLPHHQVTQSISKRVTTSSRIVIRHSHRSSVTKQHATANDQPCAGPFSSQNERKPATGSHEDATDPDRPQSHGEASTSGRLQEVAGMIDRRSMVTGAAALSALSVAAGESAAFTITSLRLQMRTQL